MGIGIEQDFCGIVDCQGIRPRHSGRYNLLLFTPVHVHATNMLVAIAPISVEEHFPPGVHRYGSWFLQILVTEDFPVLSIKGGHFKGQTLVIKPVQVS